MYASADMPVVARLRPYTWTFVVLAVVSPVIVTLCLVLWHTPLPLSETIALLEDVVRKRPIDILIPDTSYYRPLFHLTLMAIWRSTGSLEAKIASIKLLQMVPAALLVVLLVCHLRPRALADAALACVAAAVLIGSPGFRDNLELPLSYTTVGMPLAMMMWMLVSREPRAWRGVAIVVVTILAIGFKEQGLVIIPVALAAWWMRAPGATRRVAAALAAIAAAYVALRLQWHGRWPLFEQSLGLWFDLVEAQDAAIRFGAFPYWMYAYSGASTIANVLFAEPTGGLFWIIRDFSNGYREPWGILLMSSSLALTATIAWWGIRACVASLRTGRWSSEARTFVALLVSLLACGVLSFNYSRDRLGGMAAVFYALSAFYALRSAADRVSAASDPTLTPTRRFAAALALVLLAGAWEARAVGTIEWTRRISVRNELGWLVGLAPRRREFADRPEYLAIMNSMVAQGTVGTGPRPTRYPWWIARVLDPRQ